MRKRRGPRRAPPPVPELSTPSGVLFRSTRAATLHGVSVVAVLPVPLTAWLLSLPMPPGQGWESGPFVPSFWWIIPGFLVLLTLALPAAMWLVHDRYVLTFERTDAGPCLLTTWLLWVRRTRSLPPEALAGAQLDDIEGRFESLWTPSVNAPYLRVQLASGQRLVFDAEGEAPHGWAVLEAVFGPRPP